MGDQENEIPLYSDENGKTNISVRFADEDVQVTAVQLAEIYKTTRQNIGQHLENIYNDKELPKEATIKKFFIVQQEGKKFTNFSFFFLNFCNNSTFFLILYI